MLIALYKKEMSIINLSQEHSDLSNPLKKLLLYILKILGLALIYHYAARLGLLMAYVQANTSPVWPPTGIAFAALALLGIEYWPGIAIGVFVGSLITDAPLPIAFGITIGNTLEAVASVYLLKKVFKFNPSLDRLNDVVGLAVVAFFTTTLSATVGTLTLVLTTDMPLSGFFNNWLTWWIGDLLGALVVAPFLMAWLSAPRFRIQKKTGIEAFFLYFFLVLITWFVFSTIPPTGITHQAMIYVIFPFIIWSALRLEQRGATIAVVLVSAIAIWGTVSGSGPFAQETINDSLILLQTFMAIVSLIALILAATTIERRRAANTLRQRISDLDTLNIASKSFLGNFDKHNIYQLICNIAGEKIGLDGVWIEIPSPVVASSQIEASYKLAKEEIQNIKDEWQDFLVITDINSPVIKSNPQSKPYCSYAVFPLNFGGKPIGVLKLVSETTEFFNQGIILLIQSFANLAAVAIQNAWLLEEVRHGNESLHALSQRLMRAQEEERLHLSRELHDESGQLLAALMVQLGLMEKIADKPVEVKGHLDYIRNLTRGIQEKLHELAVNLRPASLDHLGLVTTVQQYIREFKRQYGISVEFEAIGLDKKRLPLDIETSLFRIIQESLTNVALHARASRVDVLLSSKKKRLVAVIEDDGVGFNPVIPSPENQLGLFGMQERIDMLRGTFTVESEPGKGTTIKVEVPYGD